MKKICAIAGHKDSWHIYCSLDEIISVFEELIKNNYTVFYNGFRGYFDELSFKALRILQQKYPYIEIYEILTYYNYKKSLPDNRKTLYFELENTYYKDLIRKRNEKMVECCDVLVCFVKYKNGGAYKMYKKAIALNKKVINLYSGELL